MYYYTVCYFTGIFYAVVRQISMLFIDNKDFAFCILDKLKAFTKSTCGLRRGGAWLIS